MILKTGLAVRAVPLRSRCKSKYADKAFFAKMALEVKKCRFFTIFVVF